MKRMITKVLPVMLALLFVCTITSESKARTDAGNGTSQNSFPERFSLLGAVTGVDRQAKTITVRTMGGQTYLVDTASAEILNQGQKSDFNSLAEGDQVRILGSLRNNRVIANSVNEVKVGYVGQQTALLGNIDSVDAGGKTIVINRANRLVRIQVPQDVNILMYGQSVDLSNIPQNAGIKVKGRWISSDTVDASYVEVYPRS